MVSQEPLFYSSTRRDQVIKLINTSVCHYCGAKDETGRGFEFPDIDMYPVCPKCMSGPLPVLHSPDSVSSVRNEARGSMLKPISRCLDGLSDTGILSTIYGDPSRQVSDSLQEAHSEERPRGWFRKRCPQCKARTYKKHHSKWMDGGLTEHHLTYYECKCGYVHIVSAGYTSHIPF